MKNTTLLLFLGLVLLVSANTYGQSQPAGMHYQAIARDSEGLPITEEEMEVEIALFTLDPVEREHYIENHITRSNQFGLINLTIGMGQALEGKFEDIPWSTQDVWVRISTKSFGDEDFSIVTSNKLHSVPYAYYANEAGRLTGPSSGNRGGDPGVSSYWSLQGNESFATEFPVLGTISRNDLNLITSDVQRMQISSKGPITMHEELTVEENTTLEKNLNVESDLFAYNNVQLNTMGGTTKIFGETEIDGRSLFGGSVGNLAEFTGPVNIIGRLTTLGGVDINSDLNVTGITNLFNTFNVQNNATSNLTGPLNVDGITNLNNHFNVNNASTSNLSGPLNVTGASTFKGRAVFDITMPNNDQLVQDNYPVLIKGSQQGLAIDLTPAVSSEFLSHRGNNYISFWRNGEQKGRIEGMSRADLDPTGLVNLFVGMINSPPTELSSLGLTYDPFSVGNPNTITDLLSFNKGTLPNLQNLLSFSAGSLPSASFSFSSGLSFSPGSLPSFTNSLPWNPGTLPGLGFTSISGFTGFSNPFSNPSLYNSFNGFINNFNGESSSYSPARTIWSGIKSTLMSAGMYPSDPTNFESQIFSNYTLDILLMGISTMKAVITFATSLTSILDPEDIFSQGVDMAVEIISLIIYGAYADINLGVAYESGSGDYAEWLKRANAGEVIIPGEVVGVIGGQISKEFTHADRFMVVSTSPVLLGNMPENAEEEKLYEKIAFMGQVPVKVQGKVTVGDYILPTGMGDGLAIAVSPENMLARDYQRIIGVAWENGESGQFINLINTAVGVNHNDMSKMIEQMQFTLNHIQETLVKLDPQYEVHEYEVGTNIFNPVALDYNVSSTHPSQVSDYFSDKEYENREAMLVDVKKAIINHTEMDLSRVPLLQFLLEHPEQANSLVSEYSSILDEMLAVRDQIISTASIE